MRLIGSISSAVAALMATAGLCHPQPQCSLSDRPILLRQADIPAMVRKAIPFAMVDPGQPFQESDVIVGTPLPHFRLICAYAIGDDFVVERERGGRGYNVGRTVLRRQGSKYIEVEPHEYGG